MNGSNYIPSWDFRLFELPSFSPLQAQEFGAETVFSASDPAWFVDRSIEALTGVAGRFFQSGPSPETVAAQAEAERRRVALEEAKRRAEEAHGRIGINIWDVLMGRTVRSGEGSGPIIGSEPTITGGPAPEGGKKVAETLKEFWGTIPAGSGVFLIGVVAVIFLLLFVRK